MTARSRYGKIRKALVLTGWLAAGAGCVTLLVAAIRHQNRSACREVKIMIEGTGHRMMDSAELVDLITEHQTRQLVGTPSGTISIKRLERKIGASPWVRDVNVFFDSRQVLWVKVWERIPIARVFTTGGQSWYLDSAGSRLPLKDYAPARLPVFTSCPLDRKTWNAADTLLCRRVAYLGAYLSAHPLWMDLVEQVDVAGSGEFDLLPAIGDCVVRIGDTSALDSKFGRLVNYYRIMVPKVGWNKYAVLDARFAGQIIGVHKDEANAPIDTARAAGLLREMIEQGKTAMQDTVIRPVAAPADLTPDIDSARDMETDATQGTTAANPAPSGKAGSPGNHAPKRATTTRQRTH